MITTFVGIAYDRWRIEQLLAEFVRLGVDAYIDGKDNELSGGIRLVPWGQGFRDMAPAVDALGGVSGSIVSSSTMAIPFWGFCFSNAIVGVSTLPAIGSSTRQRHAFASMEL